MKKLFFISLLLTILGARELTAQQTITSPTAVNGWEVLPLVDIYGVWFFDKENTYSRLGSGYQTFTISGNTRSLGSENNVKADNLKYFSNILRDDKRILGKYICFRYKISKLVGNISEVAIQIGVQNEKIYLSHIAMTTFVKNPIVSSEWIEVKLDTKEILPYLTYFTYLRFETYVISTQAGVYVSMSFDVDELWGEDSLGVKTIYDGFDITDIPEKEQLPKEIILSQNYPNPFNPTTKINFSTTKSGNYKLEVFNTLGQKVATLIDSYLAPGIQEYNFNGAHLPSGTYIYRLSGNNVILNKKMTLVK